MTTYNTGNPVGSTDPKDLYDNAQNLDALVNSTTEMSHADRLAVQRKTWHGMENQFDAAQAERAGEFAQFLADSAYQDIGVYGAGIEVTRYNQVFLKDGEFYRPAASLGLPYTTTGMWASESGSFVGVGDAVLRQDLAASSGSALVGYDGGTVQDVLDNAKAMANYTALRAYTGRATGVRITGVMGEAKQSSIAGIFQRDSSDTTSADNGGTIIIDALGRRWKRQFDSGVSVKWFGAAGNDIENDTDEFLAALAYCKAQKKALAIPDGTYLLTAGAVNFAGQGLAIVGVGKPVLHFTGAGCAFEMDTGLPNGESLSDMRVENLRIDGGPLITDGFYSRGVVRSVFRNIVVRECSAKAYHILHGVSNQYDSIKYSANEGSQTTRPSCGVYLTNNGEGYYTADCTFINCVSEDFILGIGCYIHDGSGNTFVGGTFEGCNIGLVVGVGCRRNHFIGTWFEQNATRDAEINSTANSFDDCYFGSSGSSPNIAVSTGKGTIFRGGYIRTVNLQSTSSETIFIGCGFDENLSGTLGITGPGTYRNIGASKIDNAGNVVGPLADRFLADQGTWSGALVPTTTGSITLNPSFKTGGYVKVGRMVTVTGIFIVDSVSAPVGDLTLTGLPFPVDSGGEYSRCAATIYANGLDAGAATAIMGRALSGESQIYIEKFSAGVNSALASSVKAGSQFYISMTYIASA